MTLIDILINYFERLFTTYIPRKMLRISQSKSFILIQGEWVHLKTKYVFLNLFIEIMFSFPLVHLEIPHVQTNVTLWNYCVATFFRKLKYQRLVCLFVLLVHLHYVVFYLSLFFSWVAMNVKQSWETILNIWLQSFFKIGKEIVFLLGFFSFDWKLTFFPSYPQSTTSTSFLPLLPSGYSLSVPQQMI